MMASLPTHICVTWPQWVNRLLSFKKICMTACVWDTHGRRVILKTWQIIGKIPRAYQLKSGDCSNSYMHITKRYSERFFALLVLCEWNIPVTGGFRTQRPMTRRFDVFCDLRLNKRFSKQSRHRWFETPSCSLWRHCNGLTLCVGI